MSTPLVKVSDLADQIRGVTYAKGDAELVPTPGYLPVLRAGNITEDGLIFNDLVFVPASRVSPPQKIRKHDVLIAASSGSLDVVGKAACALEDFNGGFGAFCKVLRPNSRVVPGYFAHYFKTLEYRRKISSLAAGANINNLKNEHLADLLVPLPSLPEQRRIAAILDQADALRAMRRTALVKLDTLAQSIFIEMFGDPAAASLKWPMTTVDEVADVQGGLQLTASRKAAGNEVPYLRVANVHRGSLDLGEIKSMGATAAEIARTTLLANDLLIVEGHGNPEEIGRCALWDGSIHPCIHQNHLIRARFNSALVHPHFACEYLNSPGGRQYLLRSGKTTSGLNTISVSNVRKTPMVLPPIELQRQFASHLAHIDKNKTHSKRSLFILDALFASLQHSAFRGEL